MAELHRLLRRQVKRVYGAEDVVPAAAGPLLCAVDEAYRQSDVDRAMLERALDLSSQELVQANLELRGMFRQLLEAQKMDAIGRLAGGVAHDFNNLLTAILGYSELVLESLEDPEAREHLEEVRRAGESAATLTRQLLAFSRRQVLQPRVVSLNDVVEALLRMLQRLLGEDVRLVPRLDPELRCVRADPAQLEQVIVNLAVNARDAMPEGGEIVIETRNAGPGARRNGGPAPRPPGDHVVLRVCDDGHGMDAETLSHVFEPFFTTKEVKHGTGLGLATVHGIVEQSGGRVTVESEPGRGTVFEIVLPAVDGAPEAAPRPPRPGDRTHGSETVLVVEDEDAVRALARDVLSTRGYAVLEAGTGREAVALAERHAGDLGLLLADVVLPDLSGPAVAAILRARRPDLKVLYMSGYPEERLAANRVLDGDVRLLHKPFTPSSLLARVQARLRE